VLRVRPEEVDEWEVLCLLQVLNKQLLLLARPCPLQLLLQRS